MTSYLESLKANRSFILITELGAVLHDIGKLDERWPKLEGNKYVHENEIIDIDVCDEDVRQNLDKTKCDKTFYCAAEKAKFYSINHFIKYHSETDGKGPLRHIIRISDLWSATEDRNIPENKMDEKQKEELDQNPKHFISNSFGQEVIIDRSGLCDIRKQIEQLIENSKYLFVSDINTFAFNVKENTLSILATCNAIASTYRPTNDVLLYDHSISTATIYKPFLNQSILGREVTSKNIYPSAIRDYFSIVSLGFDLSKLFAQTEKIGDLIGRLQLLKNIQNILKQKLEIEYAVGNEIYRDHELSCFLLPVQFSEKYDENENENEIESFINDLLFECCCDDAFIVTYKIELCKTQRIYNDLPQVIGNFKGVNLPANPWHADSLSAIWDAAPVYAEVCPLCGLLPAVSKSNKNRNERLCKSCDKLRKTGQKARDNEDGSIWLDEIADPETNRIAVLSVEIPLERWLCSNGMLQMHQFKIKTKDDDINKTKELSYERIRRFYATTETYFNQLTEKIKTDLDICERLQLEITHSLQPIVLEKNRFYSYSQPENGNTGELYLSGDGSWITVSRIDNSSLLQEGDALKLKLTNPRAKDFEAVIKRIEIKSYYPYAEVLRSQNSLMLLVPARKARGLAVNAVELFKQQFSKALGKLPLSIGIIYAPVKSPLSFSLQASLNMCKILRERSNSLLEAKVVNDSDDFGEYTNLSLKIDGVPEKDIKMKIHSKLGNNETGNMDKEDIYYTRLPVIESSRLSEHVNEQDVIKDISLWDGKDYKPVLANQLKKDNCLRILTGAFDFEFLDSTARRFDLLPTKHKQEQHSLRSRELNINHLNLLQNLEEAFKEQSYVTDTQIRNVYAILTAKFCEWHLEIASRKDRAWLHFDKLTCAVLNKEFHFSSDKLRFVKESVLSGLFFDWFELYYRIEKRKIREG